MFVATSIGAPNILNFYLNASTDSTQFFRAIISLPNILVSTAFCRLLCKIMGDLLQNIRTTVWLLLDIKLPARSASTKQWVEIESPKSSGQSYGIASFALWYKLYQSYLLNMRSSILGCSTSNTISLFGCSFRCPNMWINCSRLPMHGSSRCADINDVSNNMLTRPNWTTHLKTPINS